MNVPFSEGRKNSVELQNVRMSFSSVKATHEDTCTGCCKCIVTAELTHLNELQRPLTVSYAAHQCIDFNHTHPPSLSLSLTHAQ